MPHGYVLDCPRVGQLLDLARVFLLLSEGGPSWHSEPRNGYASYPEASS